jgi:hypothetical protein
VVVSVGGWVGVDEWVGGWVGGLCLCVGGLVGGCRWVWVGLSMWVGVGGWPTVDQPKKRQAFTHLLSLTTHALINPQPTYQPPHTTTTTMVI